MKREGNLYDLKVNLDYFQTNLDLKKLIKKLNKKFINVYFDHPVKHFKGNQLFDRIVESTKKLTEFQKLLICNPIDLCEDQKQRKKLDNLNFKMAKLTRDGKLLPLINNNFKFIKQIKFSFYKESYHLTCTYSKLNKTYYLENFKRGEFGGVGISFKSKNKLSVLRKMEQLKKMTIKFKNEKNRN